MYNVREVLSAILKSLWAKKTSQFWLLVPDEVSVCNLQILQVILEVTAGNAFTKVGFYLPYSDKLTESMSELPSLNAALFVIGLQLIVQQNNYKSFVIVLYSNQIMFPITSIIGLFHLPAGKINCFFRSKIGLKI